MGCTSTCVGFPMNFYIVLLYMRLEFGVRTIGIVDFKCTIELVFFAYMSGATLMVEWTHSFSAACNDPISCKCAYNSATRHFLASLYLLYVVFVCGPLELPSMLGTLLSSIVEISPASSITILLLSFYSPSPSQHGS